MHVTKNKRTIRFYTILLMAMVIVSSSGVAQVADHVAHAQTETTNQSGTKTNAGSVRMEQFEPYYVDVFAEWEKKGYQAANAKVQIPGSQIVGQSQYNLAEVGQYEGKDNVLIWRSNRENWVEYEVEVPQDGYYEMHMTFHPYDDPARTSMNRRPSVLSVMIDGEFQHRESRSIAFRRQFEDVLPAKKDVNGDDIRPGSIDISQWTTAPFVDNGGVSALPIKFYYTKGQHTIRLSGFEPIVIESFTLQSPVKLDSYETVAAKYPTGQTQSKEVQIIQAEEMTWKNDVAIQIQSDKDPATVPPAKGNVVFNSVGGSRWAAGGQTIGWKFSVPEDGRYKIAMRTFQGFTSNMTVFRTIAIDGKVPFKEMLDYGFPYSSKWNGTVIQDESGAAYEFYLEKGEHLLTMTANIEPFQPIIVMGEKVISLLLEVTQELKAMTGGVVDRNRTWKIVEDFPELPRRLEEIRLELLDMGDAMMEANGRRENVYIMIGTMIKDIEKYLRYPNEIPYYMDDISGLQEKVGSLRDILIKAGLQLDQIYIAPANAEFPQMEAGFMQKVSGMVYNFFYSFIKKDDLNNLDPNALNVWVNRGRDYVTLLQELSNELFTPETGIKVKVNLLPNENLLILANAAGINPDIALGQPQDKSIDFAMRNALVDLSEFPDFEEVLDEFAPGAMIPYFYNGGYYALPETQSFRVLFYRKDILSQLGLGIPDTWEDVYEMLPTLQQSGYNFNVPQDFPLFIYQHGAEYFTEDGMKTALDSPEAFHAFKMLTDLYNVYDVDLQVSSFYQHFRKGNMPIGIADYNMYVQLAVAAPELTGYWGIAPLPGVRQEDDSIVRWSSGGQSSGFIYKSSDKREQAWTFLKWLVSTDFQERYGNDLEMFNGVAFRWNTANIEAFTRLPWPHEDQQVILEQWKWFKEVPNLPGSYLIGRETSNAWNRSVIDGMNFRESLEEAILNINREMIRKSQEFGFIDKEGNILNTLDWPQVVEPWEGVDKYVTD